MCGKSFDIGSYVLLICLVFFTENKTNTKANISTKTLHHPHLHYL